MKEFLYFDKEKLSPEDFNRSLMFGEGAFETFRFKQKLPVFLDRHLQRLKSTCKYLDIMYPGDFYIETTVDTDSTNLALKVQKQKEQSCSNCRESASGEHVNSNCGDTCD